MAKIVDTAWHLRRAAALEASAFRWHRTYSRFQAQGASPEICAMFKRWAQKDWDDAQAFRNVAALAIAAGVG